MKCNKFQSVLVVVFSMGLSSLGFSQTFESQVSVCSYYDQGINNLINLADGKGSETIFSPEIILAGKGSETIAGEISLASIYKTDRDGILPIYNENFNSDQNQRYPMTFLVAGKGSETISVQTSVAAAASDGLNGSTDGVISSGVSIFRHSSFQRQNGLHLINDYLDDYSVLSPNGESNQRSNYVIRVGGKGSEVSYQQNLETMAGPIIQSLVFGGGALGYHANGCDRLTNDINNIFTSVPGTRLIGIQSVSNDSKTKNLICGGIKNHYQKIKNQISATEFNNLMRLEASIGVAMNPNMHLVKSKYSNRVSVLMGVEFPGTQSLTYTEVNFTEFVGAYRVFMGVDPQVQLKDVDPITDPMKYQEVEYRESILRGINRANTEFNCIELSDPEPVNNDAMMV